MDQLAQKHTKGGQVQASGKIIITVMCTLDSGELEFQQSCDPNLPFKDLAEFLSQTVFDQQMESNYENNIDYIVGRQIISASDTRTLEQLGIKDWDTIKMKLFLRSYLRTSSEGMIFVVIQCIHSSGELEFIQACDPNTPFRDIVPTIQNDVFAHFSEYHYEQNIDYTISGRTIYPNETRTLNQLGIKDIRLIKMKLKLKSQNS
ncbi:hypothetical protein pb186bvf_008258 [Paramecium bursaria]